MSPRAVVGAAIIVLVVALGGAMMLFAHSRGSAEPPHTPPLVALASASPSPAMTSAPTPETERPTPGPTWTPDPSAGWQQATPQPSASASPTPPPTPSTAPSAPPTPPSNAAPTSAADFNVHSQVIDIGFPLRRNTKYHYRDNWLQVRAGPPYSYNHARVGPNGQLVRLHDGIDIFAPEGSPVLSPFDGTVIDPRTHWRPWPKDRYGITVVVQSDEPATAGYMAVLVHLDADWVDVGQHVTRGQIVGTLGKTGNAEEATPQLHFELRAPFLINWSAIGENRMVDAFNPYPSLVAADPNK